VITRIIILNSFNHFTNSFESHFQLSHGYKECIINFTQSFKLNLSHNSRLIQAWSLHFFLFLYPQHNKRCIITFTQSFKLNLPHNSKLIHSKLIQAWSLHIFFLYPQHNKIFISCLIVILLTSVGTTYNVLNTHSYPFHMI
jgi:hypothetical protein